MSRRERRVGMGVVLSEGGSEEVRFVDGNSGGGWLGLLVGRERRVEAMRGRESDVLGKCLLVRGRVCMLLIVRVDL